MQVLERLAVKALAESINRLADDVVVLILVSRVVAGNFMLEVPEASVPAREICSLISAAGVSSSAQDTQ